MANKGRTLNTWIGLKNTVFIPVGKIKCYINGELRKDTPEERVRQRIVKSLVEEYGYEKDDIELGFPVTVFGTGGRFVDIAIFHEGKPHVQENIFIIVETKREEIKPTNKDYGTGQLKNYLAASLNCQYGLWTNDTNKHCYQKVRTNKIYSIVDIVDLPPKGLTLEDYEKIDFSLLRPATELRSVFKRSHNYIYGNQGLPKDAAFRELLKVIFCKVYDERESVYIKFFTTSSELKSEKGCAKVFDRISSLFKGVKDRYPHIFGTDEKIELESRVLPYVVSQLQYYSLLETDTDIKGEAYEEIVGPNLRGDRGEFFTPRNVCSMSVQMLFNTIPTDKWLNLRIIDPACGTGGFLIAVINLLSRYILDLQLKKWHDQEKATKVADSLTKDYCEMNLHGIDINPLLARATQMNEVMHGNGSGNVVSTNSLFSENRWPVHDDLSLGSFDFVFTNPPFGSKIPIDESGILEQYDLGHRWRRGKHSFSKTKSLRLKVPPEQLFIERCVQLLRAGGRLAIVLPNSILSNPSLAFIRYWILKNTEVLAVIDLPRETFLPFVGTKTSVLVLEKKSSNKIKSEEREGKLKDYDTFMAMAKTIGHDKRNFPIYHRTPDGNEILVKKQREVTKIVSGKKTVEKVVTHEPILDDDLPQVTERFTQWWRGERDEKS